MCSKFFKCKKKSTFSILYLKKPKTYTYILVYHEKITSIHSELAGEVKSNAVALTIRVVSVFAMCLCPY